MIKTSLKILAGALICATSMSAPTYSRVIIFGDSLSDIGNMPESPALIEPAYNSLAMNLYVPISNPSVGKDTPTTYTVAGTSGTGNFPAHAPQPQPPLRIGKVSFPRLAYSLSWPQFFTQQALDHKLLKSAQIWPWFWWKTHNSSNAHLSIDYAWAGAVTDNLCRDFSYNNPTKNCDAKSILAGQAAYRAAGFGRSHTTVASVQVPGLKKQVELFLQDSAGHPAIAQSDTLYAVLIGGNDLNLALMDLKKHRIISAFGRILHGSAKRVRQSIETLIDKRGARHIVIFNLFDTSQLPYLQTAIWKSGFLSVSKKPGFIKLARLMTNIYNRELGYVVKRLNRRYNRKAHQVDIQFFDFHQVMQSVQDQASFSNPSTLYQTCLGWSATHSPHYYTHANNCKKGNATYLFWNGAHPAMYLDQAIAYHLVQQLKKQTRPVSLVRPS